MTTALRSQLLDDVIAHPDDDAPRLVYADALQSRDGDDDLKRGELITIQCELAQMGWDADRLFLDWIGEERVDPPLALDDGRFAKLRRREAELFRLYGTKWLQRGRGQSKPEESFRRGFVEHLAINPSEKLGDLLQAMPLLRSIVTRATQTKTLAAFFNSPHLRKIRELNPDPTALRFLVESEHTENLRHLTLQHPGGPHDLPTLANAPFFANLDTLVLYSYGFDPSAITSLFGSSGGRLRELQIVDSRMGADAVNALVASGALAHARALALRHARLAAGECASSLFTSQKDWRSLRALDLRTNKLGAKDAAAIADQLPSLRVLDLGNNPTMSDAGIEALVSKKRKELRQLRSLALQKIGLTDAGLKELARSPLMGRLRVLDLRGNAISDSGIRAFVRDGEVKQLRTLYVGGNKITGAGKKTLKEALPKTRVF